MSRDLGLYIHVPFCRSTCGYCHFVRTTDHDRQVRSRFVSGVLTEFDQRLELCRVLRGGSRPLTTAYIGGGTPSVLEPELMERLLTGTVGRLVTAPDLELTVEANPESLTPQLASSWRALGIQRLSLGVQSLEPEVLLRLDRDCSADQARRALSLACRIFPRVAADWMLGLELDLDRLLAELSEAVALGVEHVSLYILEIHPGTPLAEAAAAGRFRRTADALVEKQYLAAAEHLEALGLQQYEVANFAKPGAVSRHNRNYWRHRPWLGLGPGAHGFWGRRRYANHARWQDWLQAVDSGRLPEVAVDPLDHGALRLEKLILGLRTTEGVPLSWLPRGSLDLERGIKEGLWRVGERRLSLTTRGFLRLDTIEEQLARWSSGGGLDKSRRD